MRRTRECKTTHSTDRLLLVTSPALTCRQRRSNSKSMGLLEGSVPPCSSRRGRNHRRTSTAELQNWWASGAILLQCQPHEAMVSQQGYLTPGASGFKLLSPNPCKSFEETCSRTMSKPHNCFMQYQGINEWLQVNAPLRTLRRPCQQISSSSKQLPG